MRGKGVCPSQGADQRPHDSYTPMRVYPETERSGRTVSSLMSSYRALLVTTKYGGDECSPKVNPTDFIGNAIDLGTLPTGLRLNTQEIASFCSTPRCGSQAQGPSTRSKTYALWL